MLSTPPEALMPRVRVRAPQAAAPLEAMPVELHDRAQEEREREGGGGLRYRRVGARRTWATAIFDLLLRTKE
jgi:hypothetical protein